MTSSVNAFDAVTTRPLGLEQPLDRALDLRAVVDSERFNAEGMRDFGEIGIVAKIGLREILVEEQFLPLAHHAKLRIVDEEDLQRQGGPAPMGGGVRVVDGRVHRLLHHGGAADRRIHRERSSRQR